MQANKWLPQWDKGAVNECPTLPLVAELTQPYTRQLKLGVRQRFVMFPYYNMRQDCVVLPPMRQFYSSACFYHALHHELIHSTGLFGRLSRASLYLNRSIEEMTAELGAVNLSTRAGILTEELAENSAQYIAGWLRDPYDIHVAQFQADAAAEYILRHKGLTTDAPMVTICNERN